MPKFNIGFLGSDGHAGTLNDMFQDSLPYHPMVEHVDWEWTSNRWGKHVLDAVGRGYIIDNINKYDLIFINPHHTHEDSPRLFKMLDDFNLWKKVILYDIDDDATFHYAEYQEKCLLYLKRAWESHFVDKVRDLSNVVPIDFPLFKWYLDVIPMNFYALRDMAVTCTLPQINRGLPRGFVVHTVKNTEWEPVDGWIQQLTLFYSSGWTLSSAATSYREEITPPAPHINWWYVYMHMLRRTKVLFNAANHTATGGHRTWEQFSSGALVVTDKIAVPTPNRPEPGKHYIQFDLDNPTKTINVVKELLKDHTERERIAKAGLEHAIKYHSSDARVDYVMNEIMKRKEV